MYMSRQQRSLLAQLRCGILPLHIESGRFQNKKDAISGQHRKLKINERTCKICKYDYIEDELHFVCICEAYSVYRKKMYDKIICKFKDFLALSDNEKFISIMKNEIKLLSMYIVESWNERNNILYA